MKKILFNAIVLVAVATSLTATAFAQRILGGYQTAAIDNEQVVAAAEFAVGKQAEEQEGLTLVSVEKAETQSAAGTNFRLCLKVSLEDEEQQVETVVHRNLKQEFSLKSWTVKNCGDAAETDKESVASVAVYFLHANLSD